MLHLYLDLVKTHGESIAQDIVTNQIKTNLTEVVFTKADGTDRILLGSIAESVVPEDAWSDSSGARAPNPDIQVIYDLENKGWRSFRWDRLVSVIVDDMS